MRQKMYHLETRKKNCTILYPRGPGKLEAKFFFIPARFCNNAWTEYKHPAFHHTIPHFTKPFFAAYLTLHQRFRRCHHRP